MKGVEMDTGEIKKRRGKMQGGRRVFTVWDLDLGPRTRSHDGRRTVS